MQSLYPYPFDIHGDEVLTLSESIAVMRALEYELYGLFGHEWRWSELRIGVASMDYHGVIYSVEWRETATRRIRVDLAKAVERPIVSPKPFPFPTP